MAVGLSKNSCQRGRCRWHLLGAAQRAIQGWIHTMDAVRTGIRRLFDKPQPSDMPTFVLNRDERRLVCACVFAIASPCRSLTGILQRHARSSLACALRVPLTMGGPRQP